MFFLVLISLERAFALIWPLLHRTTSTKTFIYGVVAAWLAGVSLGSLTWLVSYGIFEISHYTLTFSIVIVSSLATMCTSYLAIRKKLKRSDPTIGTTHQRKMVEQNTRNLTILTITTLQSKQDISDKSLSKTQGIFPKLCSL